MLEISKAGSECYFVTDKDLHRWGSSGKSIYMSISDNKEAAVIAIPVDMTR